MMHAPSIGPNGASSCLAYTLCNEHEASPLLAQTMAHVPPPLVAPLATGPSLDRLIVAYHGEIGVDYHVHVTGISDPTQRVVHFGYEYDNVRGEAVALQVPGGFVLLSADETSS
jgi:hypothetical protein